MALLIPVRVTLLLRRQALSEYSLACERGRIAAEECVVASPTTDALVDLRACRARLIDAEEALDLLGDDVATREAWKVSLDDRSRDLITALVGTALDRLSRDLESSEEEILDAADTIQHLRSLLDKLGSGARETGHAS